MIVPVLDAFTIFAHRVGELAKKPEHERPVSSIELPPQVVQCGSFPRMGLDFIEFEVVQFEFHDFSPSKKYNRRSSSAQGGAPAAYSFFDPAQRSGCRSAVRVVAGRAV